MGPKKVCCQSACRKSASFIYAPLPGVTAVSCSTNSLVITFCAANMLAHCGVWGQGVSQL